MFFFFFFFLLIWTASLLESTNKLLLSSSPPPPPLELLGKPTESFYGIARKRGSAFKSVVVSLGRSPLVSLSLSLSSSFSPINPFSLFSLSLPFFPLSRYTISLRYFIDTFALRNGTTVENFKWKIIVSTFPLRFHYLFPPRRATLHGGNDGRVSHDREHIYVYIRVYTHRYIYVCSFRTYESITIKIYVRFCRRYLRCIRVTRIHVPISIFYRFHRFTPSWQIVNPTPNFFNLRLDTRDRVFHALNLTLPRRFNPRRSCIM